jgi:hypothetical protein
VLIGTGDSHALAITCTLKLESLLKTGPQFKCHPGRKTSCQLDLFDFLFLLGCMYTNSDDGVVFAWGEGTEGRLGNVDYVNWNEPVEVHRGGELEDQYIYIIDGGYRHTLAGMLLNVFNLSMVCD